MNKTNQLALKLNTQIKQTEEFIEYMHSLSSLQLHPELFELEKELKNLQQAILKERTKKEGDSFDLEAVYHKKMEEFQNHPLIVNYLNDKENLVSLVDFIKTYIQGLLD